jgi:SpoVK/Ycf46/Vps4 family AAA+-type ATPase
LYPTDSLEDVGLDGETKKHISDCVLTFDTMKGEYSRLGIDDKITYGLAQVLLFYGTSGTGKTMLANAIAAKLKKKALVVNFPSLGLKESGSLVKFFFPEARINNAPLFFDRVRVALYVS